MYEIRLNPIAPTADHLRATLIHEVMHLLDADLGIRGGNHDRLWVKRLTELARMFPPKAIGGE